VHLLTATFVDFACHQSGKSSLERVPARYGNTSGVDHIPAGVDFVAHLNSQVATCNIILVVIGPHWLEANDENGGRRLDNPDDFVAIEIATALARNIRVIPVLVDGARMPKASELPDPLKALARRQAVEAREKKGSYDRAIADYNEAIRLNPIDAISFCRRGRAKLKINEQGGDADIARARH
jgi:TPR repeat